MGELIKTFVNEGGDTGFMSVLKTDPSQQGSTTEALTDFNEAVNTSTELADSNINVEQAVADSIRENASNPNTAPKVQAALAEGITALTKIESRIKADSGIANHQGIDIEAIHDTYMGFARSEISTEAAAQAMAENIRAVIQTRALTVSERTQLMGVLTEIVGDAGLADAYAGTNIQNRTQENTTETLYEEEENGYNEPQGNKEQANRSFEFLGKIEELGNNLLDIMETSGGHTIERHVNKSIEYLTERAKKLNGEGATSYYDKVIAIKAVRDAIMQHSVEINDWLHNSIKYKLVLDTKHSFKVGRGVLKATERIFGNLDLTRIVLIRDNSDLGFRILTAFPIFAFSKGGDYEN